jgi:hypothetical protein
VIRHMAVKFTSSAVCGVLFAPWTVRYFQVSSGDHILVISGILSLVGVTVLHHLAPLIGILSEKLFYMWVKKKTGVDLEDDDKTPPKTDKD